MRQLVTNLIISNELIQNRIILLRNKRIILDKDIARMYGVSTSRLNEQVKRNLKRFPDDFMFQLSKEEFSTLISQNATSKLKRGGTRKLPYAFTEHGVAMLSSVLKSERAITVNIQIVRVFVKLREILSTHIELANKLRELELKIESHDEQITTLFEAINQLIQPPEKPKRQIGFQVKEPKQKYSSKQR